MLEGSDETILQTSVKQLARISFSIFKAVDPVSMKFSATCWGMASPRRSNTHYLDRNTIKAIARNVATHHELLPKINPIIAPEPASLARLASPDRGCSV
jgi:hypothetical protein